MENQGRRIQITKNTKKNRNSTDQIQKSPKCQNLSLKHPPISQPKIQNIQLKTLQEKSLPPLTRLEIARPRWSSPSCWIPSSLQQLYVLVGSWGVLWYFARYLNGFSFFVLGVLGFSGGDEFTLWALPKCLEGTFCMVAGFVERIGVLTGQKRFLLGGVTERVV